MGIKKTDAWMEGEEEADKRGMTVQERIEGWVNKKYGKIK